MSHHEGNMHVGNFTHDSLGHTIEHRQVKVSHMSFNVQSLSNKGGHVVCESNIDLCLS